MRHKKDQNMQKLSILIVLMLAPCFAYAEIVETSDVSVIEQKLSELSKNDLLAFDVKGVLFSPKDQALSPGYVYKFKQKIKDLGSKLGQAKADHYESLVISQQEIDHVDSKIPMIIKDAQEMGVRVLALTSGKTGAFGVIDNRENLRLKRLAELGIKLGLPEDEEINLSINDLGEIDLPGALYKGGVIFASRNPKGKVLERFIDRANFRPKKIMLVDNEISKLKTVETFAREHDIDFTGVYFRKAKSLHAAEHDPGIFEKQFKILLEEGRWISDKIAKCMHELGESLGVCEK